MKRLKILVFIVLTASSEYFASVSCDDGGEGPLEDPEGSWDFIKYAPYRHLTEQCLQKCPDQNRSLTDHLELSHRKDCLLADKASTNIATCLCSIGCQLWHSALSSSCHSVCNKTDTEILEPKELYCVMGCNDALSRYLKWLKLEIGNPPAPALVADTLTATSLSLEWEIPKRLANITRGLLSSSSTYLVQYKFEEIPGDWKFCSDHVIIDANTIHVMNLQPYIKYRFRIALPLSSKQDEFLYSDESILISTMAAGRPQEPANVRAIAVDHTRISVSWTPGAFPNGPILSYKLQIKDTAPVGYSAIKDVPASDSSNFYMFEKLSPSHNYTVAVTTRNAEGEGPAATATVIMPPEPHFKDEELQPRLILGTEYTILSQGYDLLSDKPKTFYFSENRIVATAIHIEKRIIFVTEESGYVFKSPLYVEGKKLIVISPDVNTNVTPKLLSVDWLNDHLYVLGEVQHANTRVWQISRCDLEGQKSTIAIAGLTHEPKHIEVDPYNGYLFWVIPGKSPESGLFRLDLAEISNGVRHEDKPLHMIQGEKLGAFTIEHARFRLLVPNEEENTVISVNLDGKIREDIRKNTRRPKFYSVKSIVFANGLFYWTNGEEVLTEEYHKRQNSYYHNAYPDLSNGTIISVHVDLPSAQPIPIPVNPPVHVQALFGPKRAKISWEPPHLLGNQGKGAWKRWNYEIEILDEKNLNWSSHKPIQGTTFVAENLRVNSHYTLRAAAYTSAGRGPWSKEFRAKTLRNNQRRLLIWSSDEGVMQSDVLGEHVSTIVKRSDLGECDISDIAWYENLLYFICNSTLMSFDRNLTTLSRVGEAIESIAIDWIGKRLYWSNPDQQSITRADLNGEQQEPLPILQIAKEIKIDAPGGFMYYSTGHAIEGCRLNGKNRTTFYRSQLYSGMQVIGLTLDFDSRQIFWIVRSYKDSTLYSAPMLDDERTHENISASETLLTEKNLTGPLVYYSDRLLWITDENTLTISNKTGQNLAMIRHSKLNGVRSITVMDRNRTLETLVVIPDPVRVASIASFGKWNLFNITWDPVTNVNYGKVFYEVRIPMTGHSEQVKEVEDTFFEHSSDILEPYTQMDVTIRAFTYWGYSPPTRTSIFSPAAAPSAPLEPRVFVSHSNNPLQHGLNIKAVFRWRSPLKPNGPILGYRVSWTWEEDGKPRAENRTTKDLSVTFDHLVVDTKYGFQVAAFTSEGVGDSSQTIVINTRNESPIPQVISATTDGLLLVDLDLQSSVLLTHLESPVTSITYLDLMEKIFWFDENNELFSYNGTKVKLLSVTSRVLALAIDWVELVLYWSQVETNGSAIYSLNLLRFQQEKSAPQKLIYRNANITELKVSPIDRIIFWNEVNGKRSIISFYKVDQQSVETFNVLGHPCHNKTSQLRLISLDVSNGSPNILMGPDKGMAGNSLYAVSILSNMCHQFDFHFKATMTALSKDFDKFYWSDNGTIYCKNFINRRTFSYDMLSVNHLVAFYQQDYPKIDCLFPTQRQPPSYRVSLYTRETTALTVVLPEPRLETRCNISAVGIKYTIYYKQFKKGDQLSCHLDRCTVIYSFDKTARIEGLKPFTEYLFQVGLNSFYGEQIQVSTVLGPEVVLQTAPGAPSHPRNLSAEAISPTEAVVQWIPPKEFNSNAVWFEVHWQTENTKDQFKNKQQLLVPGFESTDVRRNQIMIKHFNHLNPNHTYSVWVRAYSSNRTYSETYVVNIETFPVPENITLLHTTPYSLDISWKPPQHVSRYYINYKPVLSNSTWIPIFDSAHLEESAEEEKNLTVRSLSPKVPYQFVMSLYYEKRSEPYIWPRDFSFVFETLGDVPSTPGKPVVSHVGGEAYQVIWDSSKDNGAAIDEYVLEGLQRRREVSVTEGPNGEEKNTIQVDLDNKDWALYYNGTKTYWITSAFKSIHLYGFRVRARNSYGWSNYSFESEPVADISNAGLDRTFLLTLALSSVFVILLLSLCLAMHCAYKRKLPKEHSFKDIARIPGVELSNLRELPHVEIAALPQIKKEQITMTGFLGSGAFGEVYEGIVRAVAEKEHRVAIKTLRKGATEQEKMEFLQEAQLMSNFKHEHILKLIGVCFDLDSLYIIMELMQGGDLLSYLRQSRPALGQPSPLKLIDIITMCVDVASGCRYLEEMHFVHRDLAARNCLVSSLDPVERVVKIGDFGLARDIYKNDYYRKEGEGLLPVRWMSPESLVDGVFTSQSDIWAFGVLCWEIMTLGQQPYPARNNVEVLHYVRDGGRLTKPKDCPEELHQLMRKCWEYCPENRPTFRDCLKDLKSLKEKTSSNILLTAQFPEKNIQGTVVNKSYIIQDINHNTFNHAILKNSKEAFILGGSNGSDSRFQAVPDASTTAKQIPSLPAMAGSIPPSSSTATVTPKYIEIVYDESDAIVETDLSSDPCAAIARQPYEVPIVLKPNYSSSVVGTPSCSSMFTNMNKESSPDIPAVSSNCSSLSCAGGGGDESMQALLPPPAPNNSNGSN